MHEGVRFRSAKDGIPRGVREKTIDLGSGKGRELRRRSFKIARLEGKGVAAVVRKKGYLSRRKFSGGVH